MVITLSKLNYFQNSFTTGIWKEEWIVNKTHIIYPTTPKVHCRTTWEKLKFKFATNYKHHVWWNKIYLVIRFSRQCYCQVYNSCLKCPPFAHIRRCLRCPFVNCIVNDALVHAMPSVRQKVLQFINAVQQRLMHSLLDVTPCLVTDRIKVGATRQQRIWRNKSGCRLRKKMHNVVPQNAGVLSRWKIKKSPDTSRITGNSCCHAATGTCCGNSHCWSLPQGGQRWGRWS